MTRKGLHLAGHVAVVLVIDAIALMLLSEALPGFVLDGPVVALGCAAVIGLLNAFVWPALARFTVSLSVLTLGLWALVLNAALVAIAFFIVPGATMDGLFEAVLVTLLITAITAALSKLLAIDQDDSWYFNVVRRQLERRGEAIASDVPGVVFLEVDGLGHDILRRAISNGNAPNMARWVREGTHALRRWETDWSSQTGACQAGILHGNNFDMPAFRWWEKERNRPIVTNHPRDAEELERRQSDGHGLLHGDGSSRANIFSGDAPHSMLTMSNVLKRRGSLGRDYGAYFARPYAAFRTIVLSLADILSERRAAGAQCRNDVRPRIERDRRYALIRAWATVVQLDLQVAAVVADILAGRPVIYTTFLAYDEVAHHSGIERPDTMAILRKVDRQIGRIERALTVAPRPYELVVLSDHGQSQGETFRQRYGITLEQLVDELTGTAEIGIESGGEDDARAYLRAGISESGADDSAGGRMVLAASGGEEDPVGLVPHDGDGSVRRVADLPEVSVMASGCLGLISFPRIPGRVSLETIEAQYPLLLDGLRRHPGIGFLLVRSERCGPVVLGAEGAHQLERDRVEGIDPLAPFGRNAKQHVLRTSSFPNCPDILINSRYWPELDEVAAFEELVGSHGGMGGEQSFPFVLHPVGLEWPEGEVVGAEAIHWIFKSWLGGLGQEAYRAYVAPVGELVQPRSRALPGSSSRTSVPGQYSET